MLRKVVVAIVMLIAFAVYAPAQAMKGYELYSWKVKGRWHYALLTGTNRAKSYAEIASPASERVGMAALQAELEKLKRGEEVFWMSAAHGSVMKPRAKGAHQSGQSLLREARYQARAAMNDARRRDFVFDFSG